MEVQVAANSSKLLHKSAKKNSDSQILSIPAATENSEEIGKLTARSFWCVCVISGVPARPAGDTARSWHNLDHT